MAFRFRGDRKDSDAFSRHLYYFRVCVFRSNKALSGDVHRIAIWDFIDCIKCRCVLRTPERYTSFVKSNLIFDNCMMIINGAKAHYYVSSLSSYYAHAKFYAKLQINYYCLYIAYTIIIIWHIMHRSIFRFLPHHLHLHLHFHLIIFISSFL